jgi:hypothetical protein
MRDAPQGDFLGASTLSRLQRNSFGYFLHETNPTNGLVLDKTAPHWPASIAAIGMALGAYLVGARRKFITRNEAALRTLTTLRFLAHSEQSDSADATGFRGFYYHFLNMQTGRREWCCELSSVDTAILIAGALAAAEYFDGRSRHETEIRSLVKLLYERIDWAWMLNGHDTLCHGWKPEHGFLPYHWEGYDEALILYLLALGSPTYPISPACYAAWCRTYQWKDIYGAELLYAGPLFIHEMSHIWCDFRGIRDHFMREHDCDYFENSRRATLTQQQYAIRNPLGFGHVGELCWGLTACDGPGGQTKRIAGIERVFFDYLARGAPFGPDDGTLAPWAVAAALPFAPEIVAPTIINLIALQVNVPNPYGFKASFNPAFHDQSTGDVGWVSPYHYGINEGPTVLMIENHRSGMIWSLMRNCPPLVAGLKSAGFTGGWLC